MGVRLARSSDSCGCSGVLVGALKAVLWAVLERLVSLEVQLVKLLISNGRHSVQKEPLYCFYDTREEA
jgi:hypothetical protein